MVVLLGVELSDKWLSRLDEHLADRAMVLAARVPEAEDLARHVPVAILLADLEPLTAAKLLACSRVREAAPGVVSVYLAPDDVREQLAADNLPPPDFWIRAEATRAEVGVALRAALQQSRLAALARPEGLAPPATAPSPALGLPAAAAGEARSATEHDTLLHLMSALAGDADLEHLLASYVAAATELTRCASYCLLWQDLGGGPLRTRLAQGVHPQVVAHGRLAPSDALPDWYRHSSRVLTRAELVHWPDTARARALEAELAVFRGHVAVPLNVDGLLRGLLILGEKVVGEPYTRAELETLFLVSGFVALQVRNLQLQDQLHDTKTYLERSLGGMNCGLLTMGADGRLVFCNPYAARLLGETPEQLQGADLRQLPSPLGDHLHAAFTTPAAAFSGVEVTLPRGGPRLRLSTAPLCDDGGRRTGSVMLLEDITAAAAERSESSQKDTLEALSSIVGRLAHRVRTPLTAIRTYAQLMGQAGDPEGLSRFWDETVSPELEQLERLVDEQLKLLQQPDPQLQLVSLESLVREAGAELCLTDPRCPAPEVDVVSGLPDIVADPGAMREALVYLLRHLRRTDGGATRISLELRGTNGTEQVVAHLRGGALTATAAALEVLDPVQALQQADGDLGPAISRQIIARQGGTAAAISEAGQFGFEVAFPVLTAKRLVPLGVQAND
jgi:nitrogen-specific signal transduction histidine kinase